MRNVKLDLKAQRNPAARSRRKRSWKGSQETRKLDSCPAASATSSMAVTTALPATAASCLLQPSRRRFAGAASGPSPLLVATSRRDGGSGMACSCSPGPPPAVPAERRGGGAEKATAPERTVRIVTVVDEGSVSPIKDAHWEEVMRHTVSSCSEPVSPTLSSARTVCNLSSLFFMFCLCNDVTVC
jgi:hypothetical protein